MAKLFEAIANGDSGQVWRLIQDGAPLDQIDDATEMTALAMAAESGAVEIVRMLLAAGADPDHGGPTTPLEAAVVEGHVEVARTLIEASADVHRRVADGFTPLMTAAATGNLPLVRLLLAAGARQRVENDLGETAISLAKAEGHDAIVQLLQEKRPRRSAAKPPEPAAAGSVREPPPDRAKATGEVVGSDP